MFFYIETLGCSRNQVDSEVLARQCEKTGFKRVQTPSKALFILVNTCGFIEASINESIDSILELSEYKKNGICEKILVFGCLPERFKEKIFKLLPEVDFFLGIGSFYEIIDFLKLDRVNENINKIKFIRDEYIFPNPDNFVFKDSIAYTKQIGRIAYLKISEGCDGKCSFCIISKLKGRQRSRSISQILVDAKKLVDLGVKEIILIGQDTTNYGKDLLETTSLNLLLTNLAMLSKKVWIRFLYGNPNTISTKMIKTIVSHDNLCPYLDIPIQHVSDKILKRMRRNYRKKDLINLFKKIKILMSKAVFRTTLLVGFPGETNDDFLELIDFLDIVKFDNLGVFVYSDFDDLISHLMPNHVNKEIAIYRKNILMAKQLKISNFKLNRSFGKVIDVLLESLSTSGFYKGRSMTQAPEVDGITYVASKGVNNLVGEIISIEVVDALDYDLVGETCL